VLVNWYSKLTPAVKWNTCISRWFLVRSGVRQGGVLSPVLFTIYANLFIDELRASGLGYYTFDMFMGCIMYADDIILLSGSLNDLQSMLNVCDNVSSQLLLKFKTNKCKCIAFGKMTNRAMSGDGLRLDNGVVMWFDTTEYLGIHFRCGKRLQVDIDPIRRRFYAASNSIFMNASHQDQLIQPSSVGICSCFY